MRQLKLPAVLLAISGLLLLNACNAQEEKKAAGPVAAVVNGTSIMQSSVDDFIKQRSLQGAPDTPEMRKLILEELIGREIARQDAVKQGLDKRPEVKAQMELAQGAILVNAFAQEFVKTHPVTDDQLKAEYDKIKAQAGDKQYHARHILVKTEKEAQAIIAQLKKGAKFEKLAAEKSQDPGSRPRGGDLGMNPPGQFVKPFADAMVALKKGEVTSKPVQTQFGFHVIKLEDVQELPPFEAIKAQLAPRVQQEQLRKYVDDLRAKGKVEIKMADAPAAPAAAVPAPAAPAAAAPAPAKK